MAVKDIQVDIVKQSENIAKILIRGCDCEIRKSPNGVVVMEVKKKVVK